MVDNRSRWILAHIEMERSRHKTIHGNDQQSQVALASNCARDLGPCHLNTWSGDREVRRCTVTGEGSCHICRVGDAENWVSTVAFG
jgi:hypothetical protein